MSSWVRAGVGKLPFSHTLHHGEHGGRRDGWGRGLISWGGNADLREREKATENGAAQDQTAMGP